MVRGDGSGARDLHETRKSGWSEVHAKHWLRAMEKDLFPWLGSLALPFVTAPILLHALRKIEARGAINTAHDAREFSGQVCTASPPGGASATWPPICAAR